jgi:hypothetical protein
VARGRHCVVLVVGPGRYVSIHPHGA